MKTDILYIVGKGKSGSELRWSLRSLAAHAKGIGRICIAGNIPDFIDRRKVDCLEVGDISHGLKHINILNCIFKAIDAGMVKGDFQYSSDDHFLIKDENLSRMPFWVKPGRLLTCEELRARGVSPTFYEAGLSSTRKLLDRFHLSTSLFCVHRNTWMSVTDYPRVKDILAAQDEYDAVNYGVEPTCIFMAARIERKPDTPLRMICDRKLYGYDEAHLDRETYLSTGDGMSDQLWNWMENTFAKPCKYEL